MWSLSKNTKRSLHPSLDGEPFWPNTITYAVFTRMRYDSYYELPEHPPEEIWDYSAEMDRFIDKLYPHRTNKTTVDVQTEQINE